jgi:MFS family permease
VAVLADALSFLASGALIASMKHDERAVRPPPAAAAPSFWHELREGGRVALKNSYVRALLATTTVLNIGFNMAWAVLLVFAVRELGLGAGVAGLVLSIGEVGGLLGAVVAGRVLRRFGVGPAIIGAALLFAPSLLVLAAAPESSPIPFLAGGWAVISFANVIYNTTTVSLRQAYVPQRLQGRVVGFNRSIVWGISPLGAILGGVLATLVGLRWTMVAGACVCLLALLPAIFSPVRALRELPEPFEPDDLAESRLASPTLTPAGR